MECRDKNVKELLPLYLEEALDRAEAARVEAHLGTCADCRTEFELLRMTAEEPVPDPGEEFWSGMPARVYREVRERGLQRPRSGVFDVLREALVPRRVIWTAASALLIAILAAWFTLRPTPQDVAVTALVPDAALDEMAQEYPVPDTASLGTADLDSMEAWADQNISVVAAEAGSLEPSGRREELDEELAEMDGASLERLSSMLDGLKGRERG